MLFFYCVVTQNSKTKRDIDLSHEVYHLQVYCAKKAKGCEWIEDLGEVKVHQTSLQLLDTSLMVAYLLISSVHSYCSAEFTICEMPEHLSQCTKRPFIAN